MEPNLVTAKGSICEDCGADPLVYFLDRKICKVDDDMHYRCAACGWVPYGACSLDQPPAEDE